MPLLRVDENQQAAFNAERAILKAQEAINQILSELIPYRRAEKVADILEKMKREVLSAPNQELSSDLIQLYFGKESDFDTWWKTLSPEKSLRIMQNMPTILLYAKPINIKAKEFSQEIHSEWLSHQQRAGSESENSSSKNKVALSIEEFIQSEISFLYSIAPATVILNQYLNSKQVRPEDKETIQVFLNLLKEQRAAFQALNLHELFLPKTQSLETVIGRLSAVYTSKAFEQYQFNLDKFAQIREKMNQIEKKYSDTSLGLGTSCIFSLQHYTSPLFQRLSRYPILLRELLKQAEKTDLPISSIDTIKDSIVASESRTAAYQAQEDTMSLLDGKSPSQRIEAALKGISESEQIKLVYNGLNPTAQMQIHRSIYLKQLLIEAYPTIFSTSSTGVFTAKGPNAALIYDAFGINPLAPAHTTNSLNPALFDPISLERLYNKTNQPIWCILQVIKPIDDHFTLTQKTNAYLKLVQLLSEGTLRFDDNTPALEQARAAAQVAIDMVSDRLKTNPEERTTELLTTMRSISETISSSLLIRALKNIRSRAIDTSSNESTKTVQKQYREFLNPREETSPDSTRPNTPTTSPEAKQEEEQIGRRSSHSFFNRNEHRLSTEEEHTSEFKPPEV